jgi:uncharacterized protein (DUF2336 family)
LDQLIRAIEDAIRSRDPALQSQLVHRSAEHLVQRWSRMAVDQKPAFDNLLLTLMQQVDDPGRSAFAGRLADLRRGPPRTTRLLARDPVASVAEPILRRCRSLDPEFLADVAASRGLAHRLAISVRSEIGPPLSDALLRHREPAVAGALLDNGQAAFSEDGFSILMAQAVDVEAIALRLGIHAALPRRFFPVLQDAADRRARGALDVDLAGHQPRIGGMMHDLAQALTAPLPPGRIDRFAASEAFIATRFAVRPPETALLERWISLKRIEDTLAALAQEAGLSLTLTVRAYDALQSSALAALLRGLDRPWSLLKVLLLHRHGMDETSSVLELNYRTYKDLSPASARSLLRAAALRHREAAYLAVPGRTPHAAAEAS